MDEILALFDDKKAEIEMLRKQVHDFFELDERLNQAPFPIVHSVKSRVKNRDHLKEKIERKGDITTDNFFEKITDLAGVRVLHLYQDQFKVIHEVIMEKIEEKHDWVLGETPKAYTWDPESKQFFEELGLEVEQKESFYTSIHYLVKPHELFPFYCEIQVRTLFEEIWGEIDHKINYPTPTTNVACKEQIRVLAKLVGAGSRLADSIFRSYDEDHEE